MGRYIEGDFEYKFAFGDQSSSFGEVLENVSSDCKDVFVNRWISNKDSGEKVELSFNSDEGITELKNAIKEYLGDFKEKTEEEMERWCKCEEKYGDEYWDKYMMSLFLKTIEQENWGIDIYYFGVEY